MELEDPLPSPGSSPCTSTDWRLLPPRISLMARRPWPQGGGPFEMAEIERALTHEADAMSQNSWLELLRTTANRRRTLIAVIVGWFAQWNGVNLISYYLVLVLNTIGITNVKDQTLINGLLQISNWLAAIFVSAMLVDRLGRQTKGHSLEEIQALFEGESHGAMHAEKLEDIESTQISKTGKKDKKVDLVEVA
ncbi:hypothetical protein FPOA_05460 [Fusarium poae]|uniref:Major facilitator superfamily (MFS) profile domain-containing protein n=1 Tax=Fusarium poae TaxID=36050 RepID=A0A1B8AX01_FUSPO|nr:hypothetical protein FPOA_05460 [Fusarium poae]